MGAKEDAERAMRAYEERKKKRGGGELAENPFDLSDEVKRNLRQGPPERIEDFQIPAEAQEFLNKYIDSYLDKKGSGGKKGKAREEEQPQVHMHIGKDGNVYVDGKKVEKPENVVTKRQLLDEGGAYGIRSMVNQHSRFHGLEKYLMSHIDIEKLDELYQEFSGKAQKLYDAGKLGEEDISDYIRHGLAKSVASMDVFDEFGQKFVFRKGLEEKLGGGNAKSWKRLVPFTKAWKYRKDSEVTKYLDKSMEAFGELYHFFSSVDKPESLKPIENAVETVYSAGLMEAAAGVLFEKGVMDDKKYRSLRKMARGTMKAGSNYVEKNIGDYLSASAQKLAASVFGVFGLGLLITSGMKITGGAVNNSSLLPNAGLSVLAGVLLIIIAILLFKLKRKKKFSVDKKNKKAKKRR
ncbi:MAG: hypothetical protein A2561_00980 [Candidatus Staskawiczbacteria bacterium RIFOXYD1_FULL_32_13]|uniref:Uncharacterized protein n=1 Tax=Candidatus Staskawiczbacteria bacterium RIFOXYD1_FULL_32_13 TaxID=1802234 RepID=A0A1G2JL68_9BACT|nr:MAG: hypothetical protein A2561_00980 [Candidatus Staskawiczbacteria bacterium RIFOXYD1_FULL_32_13]